MTWEQLMSRQVGELLDAINDEPHEPALADGAARLGSMVLTLARVLDQHEQKLEDLAGPK